MQDENCRENNDYLHFELLYYFITLGQNLKHDCVK